MCATCIEDVDIESAMVVGAIILRRGTAPRTGLGEG